MHPLSQTVRVRKGLDRFYEITHDQCNLIWFEFLPLGGILCIRESRLFLSRIWNYVCNWLEINLE